MLRRGKINLSMSRKEKKVMRMDYLNAIETATNIQEIYTLIKLINIEIGKFNSGEYTDEEYHTQLIEALELAEKRQFEV
jgi:hypothetical protein